MTFFKFLLPKNIENINENEKKIVITVIFYVITVKR